MLNAQSEFQRRANEIEEYISYLEKLETQVGFSVTLINTMKSSTLLMIYNIVESTMTNLIQDVFDHLQQAGISFDALNTNMKTLVLGYTKRRNPSLLVSKMNDSAISLVIACFERSDVFSGNLDCAKIRETLRDVGVATRYTYREPVLLKVKTERNDLAHGIKSFSDCGKTYSAKQLREFYSKTALVLSKVIGDFEQFLAAKAYA